MNVFLISDDKGNLNYKAMIVAYMMPLSMITMMCYFSFSKGPDADRGPAGARA